MRLELHPFRYPDPCTGKWTRARYPAERHEIEQRYAEFEITGPAQIRDVDPDARAFTSHAPLKVMRCAELRRFSERPPGLTPAIDTLETFLVQVILRRYITFCARRGRYAAMYGATCFFAEL